MQVCSKFSLQLIYSKNLILTTIRCLNKYVGHNSPSVILFRLGDKNKLPPDEFPMAAPSDEATFVTAAGLYVHDVPQTSTFKSLS
jgi:hypothetical protein